MRIKIIVLLATFAFAATAAAQSIYTSFADYCFDANYYGDL